MRQSLQRVALPPRGTHRSVMAVLRPLATERTHWRHGGQFTVVVLVGLFDCASNTTGGCSPETSLPFLEALGLTTVTSLSDPNISFCDRACVEAAAYKSISFKCPSCCNTYSTYSQGCRLLGCPFLAFPRDRCVAKSNLYRVRY